MFFKKKKRMIDVRELQKRGVVRIPKKDIVVPTNRDGFVEFGSKNRPTTSNQQTTNSELFGFMDTTNSRLPNPDSRITNLDNKIYKLEQRIELLEKKLNINNSTEQKLGPMGW
ncbi:MAG: hypothetical protein V1889_02015 [archaeon]